LPGSAGQGDEVLYARSATVGGQQFPVHWGGDNSATFESMAETLRGGLSLAASGFGFWSHDIGGFEGRPDPAVFKRWIPFGLLSSHSRLHGNHSYRVPWLFDDEPLLVRPGSVIATGARDDRPDYSYVDGVTLNVFALSDGVLETSVPALDGSPAATYRITRTGDEVRVSTVEGTDHAEVQVR